MVLVALIAAAVANPDLDWLAEREARDWRYESSTPDLAMYVRSAMQTPPYRRIWVRFEEREPRVLYGSVTYSSEADLEEVDCGQHRSRALQVVRYSAANLSGDVVESSAPEKPQWSYSLPSTFQERYVLAACAKPGS